MDPVFVVFWITMALLTGFLVTYAVRDVEVGAGLAVVASFPVIGLGLGNLMGNPFWPTLIALALIAGTTWGWGHRFFDEAWLINYAVRQLIESAHYETWGQRLARWGFPSTKQMEFVALLGTYNRIAIELDEESSRRILRHILREARSLSLPYVELSTRYVPMPQRGSGPGIMEGS